MIDMLVRLYDLPDSGELYRKVAEAGVTLRRPNGYERQIVVEFVRAHFSPKWVSETKVAFSRQPVSCFIATRAKEMLGFACYETTMKNYFGPTGVAEKARGAGSRVGAALQGARGAARRRLRLRRDRRRGAPRVLREGVRGVRDSGKRPGDLCGLVAGPVTWR